MANLRVVFLSNWFANPYKSLLISNLENQGLQVEMYRVSMIFLPQIIRQGKPDIIHFHALPIPVIWRIPVAQFFKLCLLRIQVLILHLLGIKIVWTAHEWHDKNALREHNLTPHLFANIFDNSLDAIISHCQSTKKDITKTWQLKNKGKIFVVPHGNYIDWYPNNIEQSEAKNKLGLAGKKRVFLLFGNMYPYKGILETIDSFQKLPQTEISLLIVGQSQDALLLNSITDKIKEHNNILLIPEKISDSEVQIYMKACDCVVIPYKVFTTSGVAILAMSFGRACIAPRAGFFNDILDDSGSFLYDSDDKNGLLQAMRCAIENTGNSCLADMGKHNLEVVKQWSWKSVAEETCKIYQWCFDRQH